MDFKMVKVFGIGLSKTGTTSLCEAMKILGFKKSYHNPIDIFDLERCSFANDVMVASQFVYLDKKYKGSKFILTIRDMKGWLKSCEKHFFKGRHQHQKIESNYILDVCIYGSPEFDHDIWIDKYHSHHKKVFNYFKDRKNDLLIMNICNGDGWKKLCSFLNLDIPRKRFPRKNKYEDWSGNVKHR
jgi:hypothetical protein